MSAPEAPPEQAWCPFRRFRMAREAGIMLVLACMKGEVSTHEHA